MGKDKWIVWHEGTVEKAERQRMNGHKSCVVWFTGLSGSGKSTLANTIDRILHERNCRSYVLDGDNIRHGLNSDLGFGAADRTENIRRIGEVAKLFVDSGQIVLTAFISPFRENREQVRKMFKDQEFIEVYLDCPLASVSSVTRKACTRRQGKAKSPNSQAFPPHMSNPSIQSLS